MAHIYQAARTPSKIELLQTVPQIDDVTTFGGDLTTLIRAGGSEFVLQRLLGPAVPGRSRLTGQWAGLDDPVGLAAARA